MFQLQKFSVQDGILQAAAVFFDDLCQLFHQLRQLILFLYRLVDEFHIIPPLVEDALVTIHFFLDILPVTAYQYHPIRHIGKTGADIDDGKMVVEFYVSHAAQLTAPGGGNPGW